MLKLALEPLGLLGGSVLFGIALYLAFRFCDDFFPPQVKREVAFRLQDTRTRPWPHIVVDMMDRVLVGKEPRGRWRPIFWRSTVLSFLCFLVIFFSLLMSSASFRRYLNVVNGGEGLGNLGMFFLIFNPIVDYISAIETRLVLRVMGRRRGVGWLLTLSSLDLIATAALVVVLFTAILYLMAWWRTFGSNSSLPPTPLSEAIVETIGIIRSEHPSDKVFRIYVYTTFATTVWTWLYLAAEGMFRVLPAVRRFCPVKQKPFRSIGLAVALLGGAGWFAVGVIGRMWEVMVDML